MSMSPCHIPGIGGLATSIAVTFSEPADSHMLSVNLANDHMHLLYLAVRVLVLQALDYDLVRGAPI